VLDHGPNGTIVKEHENLPVKDMPPDKNAAAIADEKSSPSRQKAVD